MSVEREIRCRSVLTASGWRGPACIRVSADGCIESIEDLAAAAPGSSALAGCIVPGMPNLHSHAFQRLMAGLTENGSGDADDFWSWREIMYRVANRIDPGQFEAICAWVQVEMLEAGYTSCAEFHYLHHRPDGSPYAAPAEMGQRLLAAAAATGIALTLLPVLYCRSGFGAAGVDGRQRRFYNSSGRFLELVQSYRDAVAGLPLHRVGIAPHSLRAVSPEDLRTVVCDRDAAEGPIHIHVAEQMAEVDGCRSALGLPPVAWLVREFDVGPNWCLVHATHLEPAELRAAAATGAVAGLCPTTEADLGDGCFSTEDWFAAGGRLGIGSDSNLRISVSEELRMIEFQARLRSQRRIVLSENGKSCGRTLFESAARGGAQALGQPVGRIEPGLRADLVELDPAHPLLRDRAGDAVLDSWIFAGGRDMVRTVWVAGNRCVQDGRHRGRAELEEPARKIMSSLA